MSEIHDQRKHAIGWASLSWFALGSGIGFGCAIALAILALGAVWFSADDIYPAFVRKSFTLSVVLGILTIPLAGLVSVIVLLRRFGATRGRIVKTTGCAIIVYVLASLPVTVFAFIALEIVAGILVTEH